MMRFMKKMIGSSQSIRDRVLGCHKNLSLFKDFQRMVMVLVQRIRDRCEDGVVCEICGPELEEFDQVTGTGIHGYYHWACVTHVE